MSEGRPFTKPERVVVECLLRRHPLSHRREVPVGDIQSDAWVRERIGYDQVNRALRNLVARGTVLKPKRGFYRLVTSEDVDLAAQAPEGRDG